jgi:Leucine-rich repeat (LRR) protein
MNDFSPASLEELRQLIECLGLKPLIELDLSHRRIEELPFPFSELTTKTITKVNLSQNFLRELPFVIHFPNLQELNLSSNSFQSFEIKFLFPFLTTLDLSSNKMTKFPSSEVLECLPTLRVLNLYNNSLTAIPTRSFEKMIKLEELNLAFNKLANIPKEISALVSLRILLLEKNLLQALPDSISQLALEDSTFDISGNQLAIPPQEVANRGFSAVKRYFQLLQQEQQARVPDLSLMNHLPSCIAMPLPPPTSSQPIPLTTPSAKKRKSFRLSDEVARDSISSAEPPTKSSQYKLIVVGREGAGKTSTIRFLTRNIVMVTGASHEEVFPQPKYGKLIDVYDSNRFLVRLFPEQSDVICRAEHIRLATASTSDSTDFDFGAVGPPHSTIGIDIDVWKPAITYALLQSQSAAPPAPASDRPLQPPSGLKSYASVLISNPLPPTNPHAMKKENPFPRSSSLASAEGFGIYEATRSLEGYQSGSDPHAPGSKPGSYSRGRVNRGSKSDPFKSDRKQIPEGKPPLDLTLSIWFVSCSLSLNPNPDHP